MTKRKGLNGQQLAIFDQPTPDEILIKGQIKNGFYSEAYDILKATGAKTSAAVFYILSRVMITNWDELWDQYESRGQAIHFDIQIHGVQFRLVNDLADSIWLDNGSQTVDIYHISDNDILDQAWISRIKGSLLRHLDQNAAQYDHLFSNFHKLPF